MCPDTVIVVQDIARRFITVGMCEEAVEAFLKANLVKEAIDCCVGLNQVNKSVCMCVCYDTAIVCSGTWRYNWPRNIVSMK